jgi:hypothetical protein
MKVTKKRGQVWIETVIYTLIGLAIMGMVLAVAKPKIDEFATMKNVDQTLEAMQNIDAKIIESLAAQANQRTADVKVSKGTLFFNLTESRIYWIVEASYKYSEENMPITKGAFTVTTYRDDGWKVRIEKSYPNLDFEFDDRTDGIRELQPAPTPHKLIMLNNGPNAEGKTRIRFSAS